MGTNGDWYTSHMLFTHVPASGFQNAFAHAVCARLKGVITTQLCLAGPLADCLSLPSLCPLYTDNMVDQTKVETSEAKANELEKKVKNEKMLSCPSLINTAFGPRICTYSFSHFSCFECTAELMFHTLTHWDCNKMYCDKWLLLTWDDKLESCADRGVTQRRSMYTSGHHVD